MRGMLRAGAVAVLVVAAACSKDSTGPGTGGTPPNVTFPTLPAELLAANCVQGNRTVYQAISGILADTDCDYGDGSFYEVWRVRIETAGTYRFDANSAFDNLLSLYRLDSVVVNTAYLTLLTYNDDRAGGNTNALVDHALSPNVDYFLMVNGFGASDVGPYTVTFTRP